MENTFDPPAIQCNNCRDIISSAYEGNWVCCGCFKNEAGNKGTYIDSTSCYTRIGGDSYTVIEEGKNE